ncbi:hypothetical protein Pst134EB_016589 [Puccinia striiformis f. sp. tritici]|uniref:Uncharacterized protein n=1 Tax=Puccinia striiformis f. sp. tritici PST-78 TaxID=1165861 RepID=A0A0L0VG55_9BASI|nr:hypothetical protein Pst134EB_016589 [Puccinia striiformis f. sp. tritici]KNE98282.1 hypothetical protein PSTG_08556 [Puccinia striiformis f. sp. tritici PST-78]
MARGNARGIRNPRKNHADTPKFRKKKTIPVRPVRNLRGQTGTPGHLFKLTSSGLPEKHQRFYLSHLHQTSSMKLSSLSVAIGLVVGIFASQTSPNSVSKLVRRGKSEDHAPFTNTYIMNDKLDYSQGALRINYPNGALAFLFDKSFKDVRRGISTTVVKDSSFQPVLYLNSQDDTCFSKSHYVEPPVSGSHNRVFSIDPRGLRRDSWVFRFIAVWGEEITYRYDRNYWNKGGKIYESRKGADEVYVGLLENQTLWEYWLNPGKKGAAAFTLSCTANAAQVEMVTLMAMVLARADTCGL